MQWVLIEHPDQIIIVEQPGRVQKVRGQQDLVLQRVMLFRGPIGQISWGHIRLQPLVKYRCAKAVKQLPTEAYVTQFSPLVPRHSPETRTAVTTGATRVSGAAATANDLWAAYTTLRSVQLLHGGSFQKSF
jgi:hypothetical protein